MGENARKRPRRGSLRALTTLLAALAAAPGPAAAQALLVRVLEPGADAPLQGALVTLGDDRGHFVASRLSDPLGRAVFAGIGPGRYTVRAEMIGHASARLPGILLEARDHAVELALPVRPLALEGLEVTAGVRCRDRTTEDVAVARVWDEVRKALEAARWTEEQGVYRHRVEATVRDVAARTGQVLDERSERSSGHARTPYASRSGQELADGGYVQRVDGERLYYAPDPEALLSDAFLATHCFDWALGEGDREGWVGLTFEPVRGRGVPDIAGTLWVDAATSELRLLEFAYRGLRDLARERGAGGEVRFQRLPDGTWIVPEWTIRMPLIATGRDLQGRTRAFPMGVREEAGRVLQLRRPGGEIVLTGSTGTITGVVADTPGTDGAPGVEVEVPGTGRSAVADSSGVFAVTGLAPGEYRVRIAGEADPEVEGVEAGPLQVGAGEVVHVRLRLPGPSDRAAAACRSGGGRPGDAVIGEVVDASSGLPLATARVELTDAAGRIRRATTGADGSFVACVAAAGGPWVARTAWGPFAAGPDTIPLERGARGSVRIPMTLAGPARVHGTIVESATSVPVEGAVVEVLVDGRDAPAPRARTGAAGRFEIEGVPGGAHRLRVSHPTYAGGTGALAVAAGELVRVEIELLRAPAELARVLPGFSSRLRGIRVRVLERTHAPGPGRGAS